MDSKTVPYEERYDLPSKPGLYVISCGSNCLYVGKTSNAARRFSSGHHLDFDLGQMSVGREPVTLEFILAPEADLDKHEAALIEIKQPKWNSQRPIGPVQKKRQTIDARITPIIRAARQSLFGVILKTRIGELMKDRGWAPLDLKDKAGVAQATAYKLSRDDVDRIDLETLGKLCVAFNTTVDRIIVAD